MASVDDDLDIAALDEQLRRRVGGTIRYLPETESTNSDAMQWASEGAPEWAVVLTDYQSLGRGRWGRTWIAPAGSSLLFSVVLRPGPEKVALLTTLAGVACCAALRAATDLVTGIRWPNDIIIGGRKTAGILVETRVLGAHVEVAVVGIGMNVSIGAEEWPPDLVERATSLKMELERSGRPLPDRATLLLGVIEALESRYTRWEPQALVGEASDLSVVLGRTVRVGRADGRAAEGVARRLTPEGALVIESSGEAITVDSGEIERLTIT
jgi:BirA family transcriptional regulator, biotin operon repressor / biotin---[acetyl-CoA-carboxylase] ligase